MKKIKLFALAVMAMLGTNAMAADFVNGQFVYEYTTPLSLVSPYSVDVKLKGVNGGATSLTGAVTIPGTFTQTLEGRSYNCTVTEVENGALQGAKITAVTIAPEIKVIGNNAFTDCSSLSSLTFQANSQLETIGTDAFSTTQIAVYDFRPCTSLQSIDNNAILQSGKKQNTLVTTVYLPVTPTLASFGTALSGLPNLETNNIKDLMIEEVVANAFNGDAKLKTLELPNTVKNIAAMAFDGSAVETLTINVDNIVSIGDGTNALYTTKTVNTVADYNGILKSLTLKGNLKGVIASNAFLENKNLATLNMSGMNFITTGQIKTLAFDKCVSITGLKIGNIGTSNGTNYTIETLAFEDCSKLASVEIGNISSPYAVAAKAFGEVTGTKYKNVLASVKIGNIAANEKVIGDGTDAGFTFPNDLSATVEIGDIESIDATNPVLPKKAFAFTATDITKYTAKITIGAVKAKGKNFAAGAFDGTVITEVTFTGDIQDNGIDVAILSDNSKLQKLTFKGSVGLEGIGANAFKGITNYSIDGGLTTIKPVVTFEGLLKSSATTPAVATAGIQMANLTDEMTVIYSYNGTDVNKNNTRIFNQDAFAASFVASPNRTVTLKVANDDLALNIRAKQTEVAGTDIFFDVKLVVVAQKLVVYQKDSGNTSYGRFQFNGTDFPAGIEISRHQNGINYTLYTTYVENDAINEVVTINMQPIPSLDGKYIFPASWLAANSPVIIVKATGTSGETTEMNYTEYTGSETVPNEGMYLPTDPTKSVQVSATNATYQQMYDATAAAPFNTLFNGTTHAVLNDLYFLTNPAAHKGISAPHFDIYKDKVEVNPGHYYVIAPHYEGAAAARIVWLDGSEEATAIEKVKTVVNDGVIYNMAGQKVDANYKGIVIKNGKKMIQK